MCVALEEDGLHLGWNLNGQICVAMAGDKFSGGLASLQSACTGCRLELRFNFNLGATRKHHQEM